MPIVLDSKRLGEILLAIHDKPDKSKEIEALLAIVNPIIRLTADRFPAHMSDDLQQEVRMSLMKKAPYLAQAYHDGKLDNPTNYLFTLCYHAGINYIKSEEKHTDHLVPISDIKIEPAISPRTYDKLRILDKVKEEVLSWIRVRFTKKIDSSRAERYVDRILGGLRPSFKTRVVEKFYKGTQAPAKDTYSIVLQKIRELLFEHQKELLED